MACHPELVEIVGSAARRARQPRQRVRDHQLRRRAEVKPL
jgi:hypothetical protein